MKTSLLALCFLLFAYSAAGIIYDDDYDPVRNGGGEYYLVPVSEPNGGVGLGPVGNDKFPAVVVEKNLTNAVPVRFAGLPDFPFIMSHLFMGINFVFPSREPAGWIVDKELTVKVGQKEIWGSPFTLRPTKDAYKMLYHHQKDNDTGADVGVVYSGGYRRLAVKDGEPFIFKITKANENSARIMSVV